jgi:hypothetical protein
MNLSNEGVKIIFTFISFIMLGLYFDNEYKICIYVFKDYILFVKSNHFQ